jgi:hypothetical protein
MTKKRSQLLQSIKRPLATKSVAESKYVVCVMFVTDCEHTLIKHEGAELNDQTNIKSNTFIRHK